MANFPGRNVAIGLGVESTAGTAVAPSFWMRHMSSDFGRKTNTIQNESAMGRIEKVNDSAVVETWAEGSLEGKVYDLSIGPLLYNIFGALVTSDNADANAVVKDHTFDALQSSTTKTLTILRADPNTTRRHAYATLESLEFTCEQGGWVMVNGAFHAQPGATASDTAAYVAENSFTSKHVTVKIASTTGGLGAASALAIKNMRLTLNREVTKFYAMGGVVPSAIDAGAFSVDGELVLRYDSTALEDIWFANTQRAMSITFKNTDVTIGTSANPGLVFTMPRLRLNTFVPSDDLDTVVEQTVGFTAELDTSAAYMIRGVLTNTQASY